MTSPSTEAPQDEAALLPQRLAGVAGLTAFVICLLLGGFAAENPLATVLWRSMMAMFGTAVVGFIVGLAAQWMLRENLRQEHELLRDQLNQAADPEADDIPVVGNR